MALTGGSQTSLPKIYSPTQLRRVYFDFGRMPFFASSSGVAIVAAVVGDGVEICRKDRSGTVQQQKTSEYDPQHDVPPVVLDVEGMYSTTLAHAPSRNPVWLWANAISH